MSADRQHPGVLGQLDSVAVRLHARVLCERVCDCVCVPVSFVGVFFIKREELYEGSASTNVEACEPGYGCGEPVCASLLTPRPLA